MNEDINKAGLAILGVVVGFILSGGQRWLERKRKLRAHLAAIRAEMKLCKQDAETLLTDNVKSPLYRLSVTAMQTGLPILLSEGHLNEEEVFALTRYSSLVQDLNRGLDYAASCLATDNQLGLDLQYNRNLLKAGHLIGENGTENVMEAAKQIVDGKLLRWWELL